MKKRYIILTIAIVFVLLILVIGGKKETVAVPTSLEFTQAERVVISGYEGHAMEPSISRDGKYLFFNSLNDGQDTSLYYAERIDETQFTFNGEVRGVNRAPPHLDAVASMDSPNNFYFVSTKDYPENYANIFTGTFLDGEVTNVRHVAGDYYIPQPGWIVMDTEVSEDGQSLYVTNAQFSGGPLPKRSQLRIAYKANGEFKTDPRSKELLKTVNDIGIVYAPSSSTDGLELFFTALEGTKTTMYVAKRTSVTEPFGKPLKINQPGEAVEGPSITRDGSAMYFHKKEGDYYAIYRAVR